MRASRERGGPTHGRDPAARGSVGAAEPAGDPAALMVGLRLAARRRATGRTLAQVAERAELSPAYISQIEAGAANPTLSTLSRVTDALDADLAEVLGGGGSDEPFPAVVRRRPVLPATTGRVWPFGSPDARRLVPRLVAGLAADHATDVRHDGEELITVLAGSYRLWVEGRVTELGVGDACHLSAVVAHRLEPVGDDALCLVVLSGA